MLQIVLKMFCCSTDDILVPIVPFFVVSSIRAGHGSPATKSLGLRDTVVNLLLRRAQKVEVISVLCNCREMGVWKYCFYSYDNF